MQKNILNYNSVENIPHINAKAAFAVNSAALFRDDGKLLPSTRVAQICHSRIVLTESFQKQKEE